MKIIRITKITCILLASFMLFSFQPARGLAYESAASEVSALFEEIRGSEAMLQFFFTQMPKGGDLHNHLTGSVYAETYFDMALSGGLWLDTDSYYLNRESDCASCIKLSPGMENELYYRARAIDHWSIRNFDYLEHKLPPDEFFFATFGKFGAITSRNHVELMKELMLRARDENVQYLEVMVTSPGIGAGFMGLYEGENDSLIESIKERDASGFYTSLEDLFQAWENDPFMQIDIEDFIEYLQSIDAATSDVAPEVTVYYQTYAGRDTADPVRVFAQLYMGFKSADVYEKLVGVNIVQPENGMYSLRDYWGHMLMFDFLKDKYDTVRTSMHAGELRLGLTPPEYMQSNIHDAVMIAGADRIGHGTAIAFEKNAPNLLRKMAADGIAIEINLTSNEFILGVKGGEHPITLYHRTGVPLVLSTDDAGILRTNLTQQFVIAALRYPELKYEDFRNFAYNSIAYSFMPDDFKDIELDKLLRQLVDFEYEIMEILGIK